MGHFAKVENGFVTQVIVVNNDTLGDLDYPDSEPVGQKFIGSLGLDGTWLQTSYNSNFRAVFAGAGHAYDSISDEFVAPIVSEIVIPKPK